MLCLGSQNHCPLVAVCGYKKLLYPDRPAPESMSSSSMAVPRIDTAKINYLCKSSIPSCSILLSSESTLTSQSTRSATWTFDSTHGATHSGSDLDEWTFQSPLHIPPSGVYKVNLLEGNLIYPCPTMVNPLMEQ